MIEEIHGLAWDICQHLEPAQDVSTSWVMVRIAARVSGDNNAIANALVALAKSGACDFVRRGAPEQRRMFGKTSIVRPWIWSKPAGPRPTVERCEKCGQVIAKKL